MDLGCSICQESFSASSTCVATKCGHVFHQNCQAEWMKNSKTCPSCRAACQQSALIRIFFTSTLSDPSQVDTESLRAKLGVTEDRVVDLTKRNKTLQDDLKVYKEKQHSLKNMVATMDDMYKRSSHHVKTLTIQLKDYDSQKARADAMSAKVTELSLKIEEMRQIEQLLNSSAQEVESLITPQTTSKTLSYLVVSLKRELEESESKKNKMFSTNCKLNNMVKQKSLEVETIQDQLSALQSELLSVQSQIQNRNNIVAKTVSSPSPVQSPVQTVPQQDSQSPYLRLASSVVGLTPLLKKPQDNSRPLRDNLQKLSIFQAGRLAKSAKVDVLPQRYFESKENVHDITKEVQELRPEILKNDRFKIDARLKSGAIKRPSPYPTK